MMPLEFSLVFSKTTLVSKMCHRQYTRAEKSKVDTFNVWVNLPQEHSNPKILKDVLEHEHMKSYMTKEGHKDYTKRPLTKEGRKENIKRLFELKE